MCVNNEEAKSFPIPLSPPILLDEGAGGSPHHLHISPYVFMHAHLNERGPGFTPTHICIGACIVHLCAYVHVRGRITPPPSLFTSTAIEHLCPALLSVATVTKAQTGVAAAARARHRGRKQKERDREIFFFLPASPDHNNRFLNSALRETRLACGDDRQVEANRKIKMRSLLSYACVIIYTHMSKD